MSCDLLCHSADCQSPLNREMWALEYEVDELQTKFAESIGTMDLDNLDVDFIEDMMLKAKPLQSVLNCIRNRQIVSACVTSIATRIPDIVGAGQAGGCEEVVCGPDQGPRGHEGDSPCQACGSREGETQKDKRKKENNNDASICVQHAEPAAAPAPAPEAAKA